MNINYILEKVYKSDRSFLFNYFLELNKITFIYSQALLKKKYLNSDELSKIRKISNFLKNNKYKKLIKKKYERGFYFEYENFFKKKIGGNISGKLHIGRSRNDLTLQFQINIKKILQKNLSNQVNLLKKFI